MIACGVTFEFGLPNKKFCRKTIKTGYKKDRIVINHG